MSPRVGASRSVVLAAFPILLTQGLRMRRTILRLPEATGTSGLVTPDDPTPDPLRLVVVGDSVAAGVGVDDHRDTVAGELAQRLASSTGRPVGWTVVAQLGLTAGEVRMLVAGRRELGDADLVVLSVGVNDTKNLHGDRQWRAELGDLLDDLLDAAPRAELFLLGIPPLDRFVALPRALRTVLGARARRMDRIGRDVAAQRPRVRRLELELGAGADLFAPDGFHPSAAAHGHFADALAEALEVSSPWTAS